jgi:hypothetical protein
VSGNYSYKVEFVPFDETRGEFIFEGYQDGCQVPDDYYK